jgi:hypothetical protein
MSASTASTQSQKEARQRLRTLLGKSLEPPDKIAIGQDKTGSTKKIESKESMSNNLIVNANESVSDGSNIPEVHAVMVTIFGTTMAAPAPALRTPIADAPNAVPQCMAVIDSLLYVDLIIRLVQVCCSREQLGATIPRSNYFQLTSPFAGGFNFNHPLNREWLSTIFKPSLRRLAAKPAAPGCAGTPPSAVRG